MVKWLLLFLLTPLVEMYILIEVGGRIGAWPTIALVVLTALIGVALLKRQGFATVRRGLARFDSGELPARELAEGLLLAIAGAVLLTPGFATDAFGFALLTPALRTRLAQWLLSRIALGSPGSVVAGRTFEGDSTPR